MEVKFCKDCKWAVPNKTSNLELRCLNPVVNAKDAWALGQEQMSGTSCHSERGRGFFSACGMKGRKWEQK